MRFVTEISLVQSGHIQPTSIENRLVDVYREKPIRLVVKVAVPVKEHPKVKVPILTSKISSICNVPPRMQITNKFLLCRTKKALLACKHRDKISEENIYLQKGGSLHI